MGKHRIYFLSVSSLVVLFVLVGILFGNVLAREANVYVYLRLFNDAVHLIEDNYVEDVERDNLLRGAYHGLFEVLDPQSEYLSPREYREVIDSTPRPRGELGMGLSRIKGHLMVIAVRPGSPADQAEIRKGAQLLRIGNLFTRAMSLGGAENHLRGEPGTEIEITLVRHPGGGSEEILLTCVPAPPPIRFEDLSGGTGYLRLSEFPADTATQVEGYLRRFLENGGTRLVLDLRDNGSRTLQPVLDTALLFLEPGPVALVEERGEERTTLAEQERKPFFQGPMVVLVNGGTASAGELLAASLQGSERSPLLGQKTFGLGTRAELFPLPNGAAVRLSTGKLVSPDGRIWHGVGLVPDVSVDLELNREALLEKAEELLRAQEESRQAGKKAA